MRGGIVGFTRKPGAVKRWVLSQVERARLIEITEKFAGLKPVSRYDLL